MDRKGSKMLSNQSYSNQLKICLSAKTLLVAVYFFFCPGVPILLELSVISVSLYNCSQSQNDDITKPCLGLMANLCRQNQSIQVQIKSQVSHAPFTYA